jgi:hypothetical protein
VKVFYTGATQFEGSQQDPYLSTGGKISSSIIPNDVLSNIFGAISKFTVYQTPGSEYRVIAIYNDSAVQYSNLRVFGEWEPVNTEEIQFANLGIGYLLPTVTSCGDIVVEQLPNIYSKPYGAEIVDTAVSATVAYQLPPLGSSMYLGIILRRTLLPAAKVPLTAEQLQNGIAQPLDEKFNLTFLWD